MPSFKCAKAISAKSLPIPVVEFSYRFGECPGLILNYLLTQEASQLRGPIALAPRSFSDKAIIQIT